MLKQSFTDFEVIIVNDGSTDESEKVVQTVNDARINYFSKKNEGISLTRNFAVEKATTDYVFFLDADDYWYPGHLENMHEMIKKFPNANWFATAHNKKYNDNLITPMISPILKKGENWIGLVDDYFRNSLVDPLAWTSAVGMKKDFFTKLNGFDISIDRAAAGEDTDLWIRAALESPLAFSTRISATHNLDGNNRISHTNVLNRAYMDLNKYEKEEEENPYLKQYLDLNRYSLAIQHKMAGDMTSYKKYAAKINLENCLLYTSDAADE